MMDRDARLAAYVDGELDPEEARAVERQLATDPQARELVRVHQRTTALLRAACAPSFYSQGTQQFGRARERAVPRRVWLQPMAIAAALLIAVLGTAIGTFVVRGIDSEAAGLLNEISSYQLVYGMETEHLVEVPATRSDDLLAWLGSRLGRKLIVPELSASGLTFAGGRLLVVDKKPVAQLVYTRPGTFPFAVCITRSSDAPSPVRVEHRNGLDLAWWRDGAYTYVIVGTMQEPEARILADRVAAALRT